MSAVYTFAAFRPGHEHKRDQLYKLALAELLQRSAILGRTALPEVDVLVLLDIILELRDFSEGESHRASRGTEAILHLILFRFPDAFTLGSAALVDGGRPSRE